MTERQSRRKRKTKRQSTHMYKHTINYPPQSDTAHVHVPERRYRHRKTTGGNIHADSKTQGGWPSRHADTGITTKRHKRSKTRKTAQETPQIQNNVQKARKYN